MRTISLLCVISAIGLTGCEVEFSATLYNDSSLVRSITILDSNRQVTVTWEAYRSGQRLATDTISVVDLDDIWVGYRETGAAPVLVCLYDLPTLTFDARLVNDTEGGQEFTLWPKHQEDNGSEEQSWIVGPSSTREAPGTTVIDRFADGIEPLILNGDCEVAVSNGDLVVVTLGANGTTCQLNPGAPSEGVTFQYVNNSNRTVTIYMVHISFSVAHLAPNEQKTLFYEAAFFDDDLSGQIDPDGDGVAAHPVQADDTNSMGQLLATTTVEYPLSGSPTVRITYSEPNGVPTLADEIASAATAREAEEADKQPNLLKLGRGIQQEMQELFRSVIPF